MFRLNEAVENWRTCVVQYGTVEPADADELESHLREDIDHLAELGLSEEESYLVAAHRLGTPPQLAAEYGKVNAGMHWARRLFWMLAGYLAVGLALNVVGTLGQWISAGVLLSGWETTPAHQAVLRTALPVILAVGLIAVAMDPKGRTWAVNAADGFAHWGRRRGGILVASVVLLCLFLRAASIGRTVVMSRVLSAEAIGREAYYTASLNLAASILMPIAVLALLVWIHRISSARPAGSRHQDSSLASG